MLKLTLTLALTLHMFTAVLLAGGKSRRMGRDKAYLEVNWQGVSMPLWKRQLAVLQSVSPEEIVISGPRKQSYPASTAVVADNWAGVGPLGGIATCLNQTRSTLLLVLAIDLPRITPGFLMKLLAKSKAGCGVVPVHQERFEPLIAVYPGAALRVALDQLQQGDYVLQHFIHKLLEAGLMIGYDVELSEEHQLENWNTPGDTGFLP
jgi:molybdopterin-guanine dinucleotide biosynthesis protein A